MKKILVLPVKNEDWILEKSLACASLWADHIIIADHNSTDASLEIYKRFPKVIVVKNESKFHSSNVRKLLLDAARQFEGQNAIFSFDADEIPTAEILQRGFWRQVEQLPPGSSVGMLWVNLWQSVRQYRTDGFFTPAYKQVGFIDDRKMEYTTLNVINDHTSRVPMAAAQNFRRFEVPKLLHYQFANWERTTSKQAHYRVTEWLQKNKSWLTALKINLKYYPTKDDRGLTTKEVPATWTAAYAEAGLNIEGFFGREVCWHDAEVLKYFAQYKPDFFSLLDIWDVDWESKRLQAKNMDMPVPEAPIVRPNPGLVGWLLKFLTPILAYRNWTAKLYAKI